MAADARRYVMLVGGEVTDEVGYARYRAAMIPILTAYGGSFDLDLAVARVLHGDGDGGMNRVFTIAFPDRPTSERFFADQRYRGVRAALFVPAVARMV